MNRLILTVALLTGIGLAVYLSPPPDHSSVGKVMTSQQGEGYPPGEKPPHGKHQEPRRVPEGASVFGPPLRTTEESDEYGEIWMQAYYLNGDVHYIRVHAPPKKSGQHATRSGGQTAAPNVPKRVDSAKADDTKSSDKKAPTEGSDVPTHTSDSSKDKTGPDVPSSSSPPSTSKHASQHVNPSSASAASADAKNKDPTPEVRPDPQPASGVDKEEDLLVFLTDLHQGIDETMRHFGRLLLALTWSESFNNIWNSNAGHVQPVQLEGFQQTARLLRVRWIDAGRQRVMNGIRDDPAAAIPHAPGWHRERDFRIFFFNKQNTGNLIRNNKHYQPYHAAPGRDDNFGPGNLPLLKGIWPPRHFNIHGLWPDAHIEMSPSDCYKRVRQDKTGTYSLSELVNPPRNSRVGPAFEEPDWVLMQEAWPRTSEPSPIAGPIGNIWLCDLLPHDNPAGVANVGTFKEWIKNSFWYDEFARHGVAAVDSSTYKDIVDVKSYFRTTLDVWTDYSLMTLLRSKDPARDAVPPHKGKYGMIRKGNEVAYEVQENGEQVKYGVLAPEVPLFLSPGYVGSAGTLRDIQLAIYRHLWNVTNGGGGLTKADVAKSFFVTCAFWNSDRVEEPGSTLLTDAELAALKNDLKEEYALITDAYVNALDRTAVWAVYEVVLCLDGAINPLRLTRCRDPPNFRLPQMRCPTEGPIYIP